ncbi:hypothetical protein ACMA1D_10880 [Streptomyces sp. 796.1]|uniref:hypothetical protein n=1 Tax=Streptomyces sp. 796.1 TaxID=3163029 RepID=UPI0039C8C1A3
MTTVEDAAPVPIPAVPHTQGRDDYDAHAEPHHTPGCGRPTERGHLSAADIDKAAATNPPRYAGGYYC